MRESTNGRCCYIVMRFISKMSLQLQTDQAIGQSYTFTGPVQSTGIICILPYCKSFHFNSTRLLPSIIQHPAIRRLTNLIVVHGTSSIVCHTQFNNHPIQHQSYNGKHNHNTQVHPIQNRRATMDPVGFPAGASLTISDGSSPW